MRYNLCDRDLKNIFRATRFQSWDQLVDHVLRNDSLDTIEIDPVQPAHGGFFILGSEATICSIDEDSTFIEPKRYNFS